MDELGARLSPQEALKLLHQTGFEKYPAKELLQYVLDQLDGLPRNEAKMLEVPEEDVTALTIITRATLADAQSIQKQAWEKLRDMAGKARTNVAQANPKHDQLSQIHGMATTILNA